MGAVSIKLYDKRGIHLRKSYKRYVTKLGRRVVITGLNLSERVAIPALATPSKAVTMA